MSDLTQLEQEILGGIAAAGDEASLEAVRVGALGKSGSVSALLKTLGGMTPDERRTKGAAINNLKDRVAAAIAARREALKSAALNARLRACSSRGDFRTAIRPKHAAASSGFARSSTTTSG